MKLVEPKIVPPLDEDFRPAILQDRAFLKEVRSSGDGVPLKIAIEGSGGNITTYETEVFSEDSGRVEESFDYVDRLVKTLLWQKGGWKVTIGGPESIGEYLKKTYSKGGKREFDAQFMGETVYKKDFTVEVTDYEDAPEENETEEPLGGHFDGNRVGFDLGASDRKMAAVIDGEPIFSDEIQWHPGVQKDPQYHFDEIKDCIEQAGEELPQVDAIGACAAGVYINNKVRVASLFRSVPDNVFEEEVEDIFLRITDEWDVPFKLVNDGEVTALVGSMQLDANGVLGIAMGSSEAGGYVTSDGNITNWLNELAFVPIDCNPDAPLDEWSAARGCGAKYFSQQAVFRLAPDVGITLDEDQTRADKLAQAQDMLENGDEDAKKIFETIGVYMGYTIPYYAEFYDDLQYVLMLGRVTSGESGSILLDKGREVLKECFPDLAEKIELHIPSEKERRVGQAMGAASLPQL